jgi:hypothetical protein
MALHDPPALGDRDSAGQCAREGAERLAVGALEQAERDAVVAAALGLGVEAQRTDAVQGGRETHRPGFLRDPVDPYRALAADRRVVDPGDEIPLQPAAVGIAARARAPVPRRAPGVQPAESSTSAGASIVTVSPSTVTVPRAVAGRLRVQIGAAP